MPRILPPCFAALVACTPSPQEAAMRNPSPTPVTAARDPGRTPVEDQNLAARGPSPAPVSAAENPAPGPLADSPTEAEGRRTLSRAVVRMGAGEHLNVELRNGQAVALRDVVMRPRDYCGVHVSGGSAGKHYCGGYGDVVAARPGAGPAHAQPDPGVANPSG